jgi:hypothetical protein
MRFIWAFRLEDSPSGHSLVVLASFVGCGLPASVPNAKCRAYLDQQPIPPIMAIVKEVTSFEDIKVQIVTSSPDLLVYVTKSKSEAKGSDAIWYYDTSFVEKKIKFVTSFPDLKIQLVNSKSDAGWKNKTHKLQNRIG